MCAPMALALVGTAVSAAGQMSQANAAANNAEYNAKVEKINARSRRQEGLSESEKIANKYNALEGEQKVAQAKSGIDPFFGSAMAIFTDTAESRGIDQGTNYINAESAAVGHENKATQYEYEAKTQRKAGKIGAVSTLIGGFANAAKSGGGVGSTLKIA